MNAIQRYVLHNTPVNEVAKYLSKSPQSPDIIQRMWEIGTPEGRRYAERQRREQLDKETGETQTFLAALTDDSWHLTGTDELDTMRVYRFVRVDQEIEVHVHRSGGDIYGIFERVNQNDLTRVLSKLNGTETAKGKLQGRLNEEVRILRRSLENVEASDYVKQILAETADRLASIVNLLRQDQ